ncbi:MAG: DMT family transporter [Calditrichota bacterium]
MSSALEQVTTRGIKSFAVPIVLVFITALWGGSFIAIKIALRQVTPMELITARFLPAALTLVGITAALSVGRGSINLWSALNRADRIKLIVSSFLVVPAYNVSLHFGETIVPAGWAGLVIALNPASISLFSALILREKITWKRWVGIALAFSGIIFIALTHETFDQGGQALPVGRVLLGLFITLGAVISWGGFSALSKDLIKSHPRILVLTWTIGLGVLWLLPVTLMDTVQTAVKLDSEFWLAVVFLAIGCTVIGFGGWYWALSQWEASRAGSFIYLVPIFALLSGRWILHEQLDLLTGVGVLLVLSGVFLAASRSPEKSQLNR